MSNFLKIVRHVVCAPLVAMIGLAAALILAAQPSLAENWATIPGTGWQIDLPDGFAPDDGPPPHFLHASGARLRGLQFPERPVVQTPNDKAGQISGTGDDRMMVDRIEPVTRPDAEGYGAFGTMLDDKRRLISVQLRGRNSTIAAVLVVRDREVAGTDIEGIYRAMLGIREMPGETGDAQWDVPFTFTVPDGMRVSGIVADTAVLLTDGPADAMQAAADQRFLGVTAMPVTGGQNLNANKNDAWALAEKLQAEVPGTEILSARAAEGPFGLQLEVKYRRPHATGAGVFGAMIIRQEGAVLFSGLMQSPEHDRAFFDLAREVFNEIRVK